MHTSRKCGSLRSRTGRHLTSISGRKRSVYPQEVFRLGIHATSRLLSIHDPGTDASCGVYYAPRQSREPSRNRQACSMRHTDFASWPAICDNAAAREDRAPRRRAPNIKSR